MGILERSTTRGEPSAEISKRRGGGVLHALKELDLSPAKVAAFALSPLSSKRKDLLDKILTTSSVEACFWPMPLDKATRNNVLHRSFTSDKDKARRPSESNISKHTCNFSSMVPRDKADMPHASSTKDRRPTRKQSSFWKRRPQRSVGNSGTARFTSSLKLSKSTLAGCRGLRRMSLTSLRRRSISSTLKCVRCANVMSCSSQLPAQSAMACLRERTSSHRLWNSSASSASSESIRVKLDKNSLSCSSGHFSRTTFMVKTNSVASKAKSSGPKTLDNCCQRCSSCESLKRSSPQHFKAQRPKPMISFKPVGSDLASAG
mmetsp:Transcript_88332/g.140540  ORF Transcript_88332/g.140540 Transcript_88332/m.140540 type:complete len:318 (-) Transcript_88332:732-1685(-)